jgi:hypothetical protein
VLKIKKPSDSSPRWGAKEGDNILSRKPLLIGAKKPAHPEKGAGFINRTYFVHIFIYL